jgi:hypothetical protein
MRSMAPAPAGLAQQAQAEPRSEPLRLPNAIPRRCAPSVGRGDSSHDCQAQARAPARPPAFGIRAPEPLERVRQKVGREPGPRVDDLDDQLDPTHPARDRDLRPGRCEPQRIVDQVVNGLADPVLVNLSHHPGPARRRHGLHVRGRCSGSGDRAGVPPVPPMSQR